MNLLVKSSHQKDQVFLSWFGDDVSGYTFNWYCLDLSWELLRYFCVIGQNSVLLIAKNFYVANNFPAARTVNYYAVWLIRFYDRVELDKNNGFYNELKCGRRNITLWIKIKKKKCVWKIILFLRYANIVNCDDGTPLLMRTHVFN